MPWIRRPCGPAALLVLLLAGCVGLIAAAGPAEAEGQPRSSGWRRRLSGPKSWPAGLDRVGQRPIGWDSARRARSAVDLRGDAVEVWLVQVGLDELIRFVLKTEPLVKDQD